MASTKSPKSTSNEGAQSPSKDESLFSKLGSTLTRKKKMKEADEVTAEGLAALNGHLNRTHIDLESDLFQMENGEERTIIEPSEKEKPELRELISLLLNWVNNELAEQRIIVKDIEDDFYDGQVLQNLYEKLTNERVAVPEVSMSETGQKAKLDDVLRCIEAKLHINFLQSYEKALWSVDMIHSKNLVATLHLLVRLARFFHAPIKLPENVTIQTLVITKREGRLETRRITEEITSSYGSDFGGTSQPTERDAFDTLFDHAPDKLAGVKKHLTNFANKHLSKINLEVTDIDTQFHDGVYLVLIMGLLEGYFVHLKSFHLTPTTFDQKVHNVSFAFELMQDAGMAKPNARPEDIVNQDLKATLRVLYSLFVKYKTTTVSNNTNATDNTAVNSATGVVQS